MPLSRQSSYCSLTFYLAGKLDYFIPGFHFFCAKLISFSMVLSHSMWILVLILFKVSKLNLNFYILRYIFSVSCVYVVRSRLIIGLIISYNNHPKDHQMGNMPIYGYVTARIIFTFLIS